jgi:hypothetical protein
MSAKYGGNKKDEMKQEMIPDNAPDLPSEE